MMNLRKIAAVGVLGLSTMLAGCGGDNLPKNSRHYVPLSGETLGLLSAKSMSKASPIMLRSYKKESELEVWKQTADGRYALLKTYPMCRWSGQLGPKKREGDRQVPEGFYTINRSQLNPNSNFYLSFNIGYPNALDRSFGRTGAAIMVHGACTSMGCFSMTDEQMADIYALMREAFDGGQQSVQMQALPFRMTAENLVKFRADDNMPFWRNLKEGVDHFEVTKTPPAVASCSKRYVFNAGSAADLSPAAPCPELAVDAEIANAVKVKNHQDMVQVAKMIQAGQRAVKRVYADGDQHDSFARGVSPRNGKISQPDALAQGPRELAVDPNKQARADAQFLTFAAQAPQLATEQPELEAATEVLAAPVASVAETVAEPDVTGSQAPVLPVPREQISEPVPTSAPIDLMLTEGN